MAKKKPPSAAFPPVPPIFMGDDKRSAILRAAHQLFLTEGFSGTSMDRVAEVANVSKMTVYAHFESKIKLFDVLVEESSKFVRSQLPPIVRQGGDPGEELRQIFAPLGMMIVYGGYNWNRMVIAESINYPEYAKIFSSYTIEPIAADVLKYVGVLEIEYGVTLAAKKHVVDAFLAIILMGPMHRLLMTGPEGIDFANALDCGIDMLMSKFPRPGDAKL
jgi:AcrR family transcriptional regulator